jgi:hypothetical protein
MKRTNVLMVAFAILTMSLIVWQRNTVEQNEGNEILLPGLGENLAGLERLEIRSADEVVSLELREGKWLISEKGGYPADFSMLSRLSDSLVEALLAEKKTARAKNFSRLDVDDIDAAGSGAHLISGLAGEYSFSILIGKSAAGRTGQFVRDPLQQQVWLTDNNIEVNSAVSAWLDPVIINVEASMISRVEQIDSSGQSQFVIEREDDKFLLKNLTDDRKLKYATVVSEVAGSLSRVRLTDVQVHDPERWTSATRSIFHLSESKTITVSAITLDDQKWLHMEEKSAGEDLEPSALSHLKNWDYQVAAYTYDDFVKRREDLLEKETTAKVERQAD